MVQDLYLHGYGRHWGERLTYSTGVAYATGLLGGGSFGLLSGAAKGGGSSRLFINSVLNGCVRYGPGVANQLAVMSIYGCCFGGLLKHANTRYPRVNAPLSGALAGALFKYAGPWRVQAAYAGAGAMLFSAADFASSRDLI